MIYIPYTIIVGNDNSLYGSCKEKILQREKLFNKIWFLVAPYYNGYDMAKATVTMRYLLPISREFKTETLTLSTERYEDYLKYILPIDTDLSKEHGDITLNLTFTMLDVDDDNKIVQRVRKTTNTIITITPIPNWDSVIPDSSLAELDQRIIKQSAQIKALENIASVLESNRVNNLRYDDIEETLQLTANGVGVGDKVNVRDMLDDGIPVVDLDSVSGGSSGGGSNSGGNNNCGHDDCDCHDNVVEFGYTPGTNVPEKPEDDDSNVVEF